ncbi:Ig-like domain-containing protein [Paenibacillus sp. NEAU-GSW1]|uniref:Ig-like domain-containing protein n=1 Tax=Paenibacillus sp. NEAU-GSW1 TaxID=2682486 RepID=UPI0012E2DE59|nr:Ig-like domain-containing protein [Paenibacillus sp. NEAU-GSW1]MUT65030.1 hypothetical protein [Paenibacillus sp. NEAU-GSW1]
MRQYRKRLSILLALALLLQLSLPQWFAGNHLIADAATGPTVTTFSPTDNNTAVAVDAPLSFTFNESVKKGTGSAAIRIYEFETQELFETYTVATNNRVAIDSSNKKVTITPSKAFAVNTDYYVLIDSGAFVSTASDTGFAGLTNASQWNFRTAVDTPPSIIYTSPANNETDVPISAPIVLAFDEAVDKGSGSIILGGQTIPVTSSQVTGEGTTQIVIKPTTPLTPNTLYTVTIDPGMFVDKTSNPLTQQLTFTFRTGLSPLNVIGAFTPGTGSSADITTKLTLNFDQEVAAASNKYIEIRRMKDNSVFETIPASGSKVRITGSNVVITPNKLEASTGYYVLINQGAFYRKGDTNTIYEGLTSATSWFFYTNANSDTTAPTIVSSKMNPVHNSTLYTLNSKLVMAFNEPVYPGIGNIEIRNKSNNALFKSIPVASNRVTGGGTDTITIDPYSSLDGGSVTPFVNNTEYYVVIAEGVFNDEANNAFKGIAAKAWSFKVALDTTKPTIVSVSPATNTEGVLANATFRATFSEPIKVVSGSTAQFVPRNPATASQVAGAISVDPDNANVLIIKPNSNLTLNAYYSLQMSSNAVTDVAGNPFIGILNEFQWAFRTIGVDTTAPVHSSSILDDNQIIMTYNELLNENSIPPLASFYVTVGGIYKAVSDVTVKEKTVTLQFASAFPSGQEVKLSYSKGNSGGIQDVSGNQAISIGNITVSAGTAAAPKPQSGTASGSTVRITFNKSLQSVSSSAYSQFKVTANGTVYTPTSVSVSGSTLTLTISSVISNQTSTYISYTPGSYPLKDAAGTAVAAFTNFKISGDTDGDLPLLVSASNNGASITLTYDESLNEGSVPPVSSYSVLVNNSLRSVTKVSVSDSNVYLTLSTAVASNDSVRVTYVAGSTKLMDDAGNAAASFSAVPAPYSTGSGSGTTAPSLKGAIVKGMTLTLTFSEALKSSYVPSTASFYVRGQNSSLQVSKVTVNGAVVTLTLNASPKIGESVTVSYFASDTGLQTSNGTKIENLNSVTVANQTTLIDTLSSDYEESAGGGIGLKVSAASISSAVSPAGVSANKYTVSGDKITAAYQAARTAGLSKLRVSFKVPATENAGIVAVPLGTLQMSAYYGSDVVFAVEYGNSTYELPVSSLNYTELSRLSTSGSTSAELLIEIDQGTSSLTSALTSAISKAKASLIAGPVNFELSVSSGGSKAAVKNLGTYVTRTIQTSFSVDQKTASVVWYDPSTSALSYVPTTFSTQNGKTVASFKRQGNSAYALVSGAVSFSDIGSHWAGTTIQILAKKYIVEGRSAGKFEPEKAITRGEFAAYIAKGLGLSGNKSAAAKFSDVNTGTAMAAYIGAASEAGIVQGNSDGTFKPNSPITRQEMAVMMTRAAKAAGVTITLPQTTSTYLNAFTDRGKVASWAKNDVAKAVYTGVITGKTTTTFSPATNATRAEAVVMIKRLLEYVKFLDT